MAENTTDTNSNDSNNGTEIDRSIFSEEFQALPYFEDILEESQKSLYMQAILQDLAEREIKIGIHPDPNQQGLWTDGRTITFTKDILPNTGIDVEKIHLDLILMQIAHEGGHIREIAERHAQGIRANDPTEYAKIALRSEGYAHLDEYVVGTQLGATFGNNRLNIQTRLNEYLARDSELEQEVLTRNTLAPQSDKMRDFDRTMVEVGDQEARTRIPSSTEAMKYPEFYAKVWAVNHVLVSYNLSEELDTKSLCSHHITLERSHDNVWTMTGKDIPLKNGDTISFDPITVTDWQHNIEGVPLTQKDQAGHVTTLEPYTREAESGQMLLYPEAEMTRSGDPHLDALFKAMDDPNALTQALTDLRHSNFGQAFHTEIQTEAAEMQRQEALVLQQQQQEHIQQQQTQQTEAPSKTQSRGMER